MILGVLKKKSRIMSDNCGKCRKTVSNTDTALQCEMCEKWFHVSCESIQLELYKMLQKFNSQMWFCSTCKTEVKRNNEKIRELEKKNELMESKVKILEENWGILRKEILEEAVAKVKTEVGEDLVKRTAKYVMEQMKEDNERDKKKENIIMYNVEESKMENIDERIKEDAKRVCDIYDNSLEVREYTIEKIIRLGKREDGRNRPLLIKLRNEREKWNIIKNAKKLKHERAEDKKRVGISLDLTEKERDIDRKLRTELKERRDNGEVGLYIKNGKLARVREEH